MSNAIEAFAAFLAAGRRDYSAAAVKRSATSILDTVGCMLLGSGEPATKAAIEAFGAWGRGPAMVAASGLGLAPPWAALVNAVAAHALDFDDWDFPGSTHPSAVMVPALLAVMSEGAFSGADLVDAHIAGFEVIARMGEAVNLSHYRLGWHATGTLGALGAAAACARALRLDAAQAANAISIATSMAGGYVSQFGTMTKPFHAGFAAKAGVVASRLAACGVTAGAAALDGPAGFAKLMVEPGEARFAPALAKLGRPWAIEEHGICLKPYPSCSYTHRSIDAALEARAGMDADLDAIERVDVSLPDFHLAILPFGVPETTEQALFSTAWCVAVALARGDVGVADFTPAAIRQPMLRALAARTSVTARKPKDPRQNCDPQDPDTVRVALRGGGARSAAVGTGLGTPGNPMSDERVDAKFAQCAARRLPADRAKTLLALLRDLPAAPSLAPLLQALG
ncbi:MAG: MmgE/PrpD family protein [Alphaproteobacteria bacterium]|nr:MmgE/PrpD family protein [Alphaproteobacteria bacterium]